MRVVALDLPTSWAMATTDAFTSRMFEAINSMLLDMLAAISRKDYEVRRRRQKQGQDRARAEGRLRGRPEDAKHNAKIAAMLAVGTAYTRCRPYLSMSLALRFGSLCGQSGRFCILKSTLVMPQKRHLPFSVQA